MMRFNAYLVRIREWLRALRFADYVLSEPKPEGDGHGH